jgi:hypothetical protein
MFGDVIVLAVILVVLVAMLVFLIHHKQNPRFRLGCQVNLSGIGKAMMIYAHDNEGRLPRAGGPDSIWAARAPDWTGSDRAEAFGLDRADGSGGQASISASLYLLVKYAEMKPKVFVCPFEKGVSDFKPREYGVRDKELFDLWDFGPDPPRHCSYTYHMPFGQYTTSGEPGFAIAADRNPWIDSPSAKARPFSKFKPDIPPHEGTDADARAGNCLAHEGYGQQVLFLDIHVEFAKRAYCSLDDDNIYTSWDGDDKVRGTPPVPCESQPASAVDSFLVNDPPARR